MECASRSAGEAADLDRGWIMNDKKEFLTVTEICVVLGIDRSTFYRCRIAEQLRPYKVGKRVKYKRSDVERLRIS